jgi:hypothetical protein
LFPIQIVSLRALNPNSTFFLCRHSYPFKFNFNLLRCSLYVWWCDELHPPHHRCPSPSDDVQMRRFKIVVVGMSFPRRRRSACFDSDLLSCSIHGGFVVCRYVMGRPLLQCCLWRRSSYCFLIRCVIDSWWAFQCFDSLIIIQIC